MDFIGGLLLQKQRAGLRAAAVAHQGGAVSNLGHRHGVHLGCIQAVATRHSSDLFTIMRGM
jgi:hypothetical protein